MLSIGGAMNLAHAGDALSLETPAPTGEVGEVKWALPYTEPETIDWIYSWDYGAQNTVLANLCEGLRRINPDGTIGFALASAVRSPDITTYVYTLRGDVKFTNGAQMTAEDVAFSLNRNLTAQPSSYWGLWYQNVASVTATGALEVTVKLKQPDMLFDSMMSTPAGYVAQKTYVQEKGSTYGAAGGGVMCTGPFSIGEWNPGHAITLARNDGYWDPALKPKAQTVTFSFIPDPSAMAAALQTGEVDGAWAPATTMLKTLSEADNGALYMNSGSEMVVMQLANLKGPLADKRIREALRSVVDYDGIVKGILVGAGAVEATLSPPAIWGDQQAVWRKAVGQVPTPKQNLDRAKKLVVDAGAPSQPIVVAVSSDDTLIVSAVTAIQDAANSVGLKIEIKKYPAQEYINLFYDPAARTGIDLLVNMVTADIPDPLEIFSQIAPGAAFNFANIDDPAFAEPLRAALKEPNPTKRAELTGQAQQALIDGQYIFPIYTVNARVFLGERITGVPVTTMSQFYYPWAARIGQR